VPSACSVHDSAPRWEQELIPVRDLSITSGALLGATRYAMTDWATHPEAHDVEQVIDELVRLFVSGLGYVPPAGAETG
jgi:hypothetical protein